MNINKVSESALSNARGLLDPFYLAVPDLHYFQMLTHLNKRSDKLLRRTTQHVAPITDIFDQTAFASLPD